MASWNSWFATSEGSERESRRSMTGDVGRLFEELVLLLEQTIAATELGPVLTVNPPGGGGSL